MVGQGRKKLCCDIAFYVAIEFWLRPKGLLLRHNIFLCHDRVWPRHEILGHDKVVIGFFFVATEDRQD